MDFYAKKLYFLCFRIIENKVNDEKAVYFRSLIKDWGLSNSTLEEVFMKVVFFLFGFKWIIIFE